MIKVDKKQKGKVSLTLSVVSSPLLLNPFKKNWKKNYPFHFENTHHNALAPLWQHSKVFLNRLLLLLPFIRHHFFMFLFDAMQRLVKKLWVQKFAVVARLHTCIYRRHTILLLYMPSRIQNYNFCSQTFSYNVLCNCFITSVS